MNRRKYLALSGTGITATLAGCLPDIETVEELPRPVLGNEDSSVVLRVFEDLGCPACAQYSTTVQPSLVEEYVETGDIRYEFYDYVIPANPNLSRFLNNSARAVQDRQGNQAFWDFSKEIFENQADAGLDLVKETAEQLGVENPAEMANKADGGVYDPVIDSDIELGDNEYNVSATPTLVLNDQVLSSSTTSNFDALSNSIETALDQ